MSRTPPRSRLGRLARRASRHAARVSLAAVAVRLAADIAGPVAAAALTSLLFAVAAVVWWARVVEPRLFAPRYPTTAPPAQVVRRAAVEDHERHVAFARALVLVAARYLAQCEHQARQPGGGR